MTVLGKRKARSTTATEPPSTISADDAAAIFRKHFEARFQPLQASIGAESDEDDEEDEDDETEDEVSEESEWGGLSDSEDEPFPAIQVVDHSTNTVSGLESSMTKRELRAYMSSKVTSLSAISTTTRTPKPTDDEDPQNEDAPSLLANDLALQRLISESHLLTSSTPSLAAALSSPGAQNAQAPLFASGKIRQRATDLRIQALGSRASVFKQERMPMGVRKGIAAAATNREAARRREARENGIVLERPGAKKAGAAGGAGARKSRDVGVDMPGVGRMRGAELRLSKRDIRDIEGPKQAFGKKKKKRR